MRRSDAHDVDPEVLAELDAIDATLAGEPVDPIHADLAELALLLSGDAPRPEPEFANELDRRVARRFEPVVSTAAPTTGRRFSRWMAGPAVAVVAAVAVAVVVVSNGGGLGSGGRVSGGPVVTYGKPSRGSSLNARRKAPQATNVNTTASTLTTPARSATAGAGQTGALGSYATATFAPSPATGTTGKVIQSAQISLTTPNAHVDQVSQEVFNVVAAEHGRVQSSAITAATTGNGGGYADFTLSIPTANLQAAMTDLSRLRYAAVSSRTDGTQSVSNQYSNDQRKLADAQALRTSLLKQLQVADSETAIDSIEAQLKTANSEISGAQSALESLNHRISNSTVTVQINSGGLPIVLASHHSRGFTISRAGHDALRVLVVSVGVALIALAVLVPVGLVVLVLVWIGLALRQRRREHALDAR